MSETATCKKIFAPYVKDRYGIDLAFGGDKIADHAWTFDMYTPYCSVGGDRQILRGDATKLPFICDEAMDWIFSSHFCEDLSYSELRTCLIEWRRCLRTDGLLLINCPDQQKFLAHCKATTQPVNLAHKEQDFSLKTFKEVLFSVGNWAIDFEEPNHGPYSFLIVARRIA